MGFITIRIALSELSDVVHCRIWCVGSAAAFQGLVSLSRTLVGLAHRAVILRNPVLVATYVVWKALLLSCL